MKIPTNLKPKLEKDFKEWLSKNNKSNNKAIAIAAKSFYEPAWIASENDDFIYSFYKKHNLGVPNWEGEQTDICVICGMEGGPLITVRSCVPFSKEIWRTLSRFVVDKIESKKNIKKYTETNYYASVFTKIFKDAPFIYEPEVYYTGFLDYDGN